MPKDIAIKVEGVGKVFKLPHENHSSLKSALINLYHHKKGYDLQKALENVSFEVKKGEFFGIVGRNGSGKSTLLKLLAGIYIPTEGTIFVDGKLTPFIELGVGFNMELTGRENIFLNGALLGFNRREMSSMYQNIVDFAELNSFMDQKLKNYSSGMQVRLAFSIAIRAKSDILLFDEVLAVGDASFQQKCFDVFAELKKQGVTIILVTHDMSAVLRFCDRAMLIESGVVVKNGEPALIAESYLELNYDDSKDTKGGIVVNDNKEDKSKPYIKSVILNGVKNNTEYKFNPGEKIKVIIEYMNPQAQSIHFGLQIFNNTGVYCFGTNTKISGIESTDKKAGKVNILLSAELTPGNYYINVATMNDSGTSVYNYKARAAHFRVMKTTNVEGVALLEHVWSMTDV
jgi:ABC-2 type transport system ATP-binding protein